MIFLVLGVLIWSCAHLVPALELPLRAACIQRIGEGPYKGAFALSVVGSIVLMVVGWQSANPVGLYAPPSWGATFANLAMFVALFSFIGSNVPTNLKRVVRHPQLVGLAVWAFAHLLANGDVRSLVLFGGLGLWAVLEIASLNRRDGAWQKPEPLPLSAELKPLVATAVVYVALVFGHPYFAGASPFGG